MKRTENLKITKVDKFISANSASVYASVAVTPDLVLFHTFACITNSTELVKFMNF